jgi:hypothetical protein
LVDQGVLAEEVIPMAFRGYEGGVRTMIVFAIDFKSVFVERRKQGVVDAARVAIKVEKGPLRLKQLGAHEADGFLKDVDEPVFGRTGDETVAIIREDVSLVVGFAGHS